VKEAARLLYVGVTRARDYLILPIDDGSSAKFISEVLGEEKSIDLPIEEGSQKLPWSKTSDKAVIVKKISDIDETPMPSALGATIAVPKAFSGAKVHEPYSINPSSQEEISGAKTFLFGSYGKRLTVKTKVDDDKFGDCLHDIAALENLSIEAVERILTNYKLNTILEAPEILEQMKFYEAFLKSKGIGSIIREVPVMANLEGRLATGIIDQLAENEEGCVLIDHKSYQGTELESKALSFSGQLNLYGEMLGKGGKKTSRFLIHFIALGVIYEIGFEG
jgi:hypothetical protein